LPSTPGVPSAAQASAIHCTKAEYYILPLSITALSLRDDLHAVESEALLDNNPRTDALLFQSSA
jgi:hypothetical protein